MSRQNKHFCLLVQINGFLFSLPSSGAGGAVSSSASPRQDYSRQASPHSVDDDDEDDDDNDNKDNGSNDDSDSDERGVGSPSASSASDSSSSSYTPGMFSSKRRTLSLLGLHDMIKIISC